MKKYIKLYFPIFILSLVIIGFIGFYLYPFGKIRVILGCGICVILILWFCIKASYNRYKCDILMQQSLIFNYLDNILYHLRLLVYSNNQDLKIIKALEEKFYEAIELYKRKFDIQDDSGTISFYKEKLKVILNGLPIEN
jgi:hypothetical protein